MMDHRKYTIISQDEPVGYIGTAALPFVPSIFQVMEFGEEIGDQMYVVVNTDITPKLNKVYVRKVKYLNRGKLNTEEYESEIRQQTMGTIMDFMYRFNIQMRSSGGQVYLIYALLIPNSTKCYRDLKSENSDLVSALCGLRNQMIDNDVIKRGEW